MRPQLRAGLQQATSSISTEPLGIGRRVEARWTDENYTGVIVGCPSTSTRSVHYDVDDEIIEESINILTDITCCATPTTSLTCSPSPQDQICFPCGDGADDADVQHVSMKKVLSPARCARFEKFFFQAQGTGIFPLKTFEELSDFAESEDVDPRTCIAFTEEQSDTPSPNNAGKPGNSRHQLAANVMNAMIMQLQQCCAGCGMSFSQLSALQMQAIEYAHRPGTQKKGPRQTGNNARSSNFKATFTE